MKKYMLILFLLSCSPLFLVGAEQEPGSDGLDKDIINALEQKMKLIFGDVLDNLTSSRKRVPNFSVGIDEDNGMITKLGKDGWVHLVGDLMSIKFEEGKIKTQLGDTTPGGFRTWACEVCNERDIDQNEDEDEDECRKPNIQSIYLYNRRLNTGRAFWPEDIHQRSAEEDTREVVKFFEAPGEGKKYMFSGTVFGAKGLTRENLSL